MITKKEVHEQQVSNYIDEVDDLNNKHLDRPDIVCVEIVQQVPGQDSLLVPPLHHVQYQGVHTMYYPRYLNRW